MKFFFSLFIFFPAFLLAQKKSYSLDYLFNGAVYQSNPWLGRFSYRTNPVWSYGAGIKANFLLYKGIEVSLHSKLQITKQPFEIIGGPIFSTNQGIKVYFKTHFVDVGFLIGKKIPINKKFNLKFSAGFSRLIFEPFLNISQQGQFVTRGTNYFEANDTEYGINYLSIARDNDFNWAFDTNAEIELKLSSRISLVWGLESRIGLSQLLTYEIYFDTFIKNSQQPVIANSVYYATYSGTGFNTHIGLRSYLFADKK